MREMVRGRGRVSTPGHFGIAAILPFLIALLPAGSTEHDTGCLDWSSGDPWTTNIIDLTLVSGGYYYLEEREYGVTVLWFTLPGSALAGGLTNHLGEPAKSSGGTWFYEETNGLPNQQRGGIGITGDCFPPPPLACLWVDQDPINDGTCGHGPDKIIW